MKANEMPERIYIFDYNDAMVTPLEGDTVYVREDAFIEKALKFLDGCIPDYMELKHANVDTFMDIDNERFIEDFKNYMKGEKVWK